MCRQSPGLGGDVGSVQGDAHDLAGRQGPQLRSLIVVTQDAIVRESKVGEASGTVLTHTYAVPVSPPAKTESGLCRGR